MKKYKRLIIDSIVLLVIFAISIAFVVFGKFNWQSWAIFLIVSYFFNTIFIIFSITNHDNSIEKLSWLFFIIAIPYVGIVFYSLFRIRRESGLEIDAFEKEFKEFQISSFKPEKNNQENSLVKWQSNFVRRNFHDSNLTIFNNGYQAYEKLLEDIEKAKKYIHIQMYIIKESEIYEKLKNALFKKAKENVEVRMIIDKFGSWKIPIDEFKHLKENGIKLCFYNIPYYPYVRHTDNKRLHRKLFIIDGEVVHFGGLNISDEYFSLNKKYGYWADSNFCAKGQIVNDYQSVFLFDWYKQNKEKLNINDYVINNKKIQNSNCKILTFEQGPTKNINFLEESINYWINNSFKKIKITTPYFIPTNKVFNSLKNALRRGVEIEIYIPGKPDKWFTYVATLFYSNEITKYGAKVYKFNETFLHSKFGIFDNEFAYIGTNNLDMRSFFTNEESINLLFGKEVIDELNKTLRKYKSLSNIHIYDDSRFKKIIKKFIFKLVAPLM